MNDRLKGMGRSVADNPNLPGPTDKTGPAAPPPPVLAIKLAVEWGRWMWAVLEYGGDKLCIECGVDEPCEWATDPTGLDEDNLILFGDMGRDEPPPPPPPPPEFLD